MKNLYGHPELQPCGDTNHSHGSWDHQKKCSETGGGVHQVCTRMNNKSDTFSSITGQSSWSADRNGQNHCLCLGAYALHAAKVGPELDLKCDAIPDIALTPRYVQQWSTWNGLELPQQIEKGMHRLVEECTLQAPDEESRQHLHGLACGMVRAGHISAPAGVECTDDHAQQEEVEEEVEEELEEVEEELEGVQRALEVGRLRDHYGAIFGIDGKHPFARNNRNVGGHLWAAHILDHASQHTEEEVLALFSEYCPVSGSPVAPGRPAFPFSLNTDRQGVDIADHGATGVHHCCRPCICDLQDGTRTAPLDVDLKDGQTASLTVLTLRVNPCDGKPDGDQRMPGAPAVHCTDGNLTGAYTVEVDGEPLPIIGVVQEGLDRTEQHAQDAASYCAQRKATGYRGGMGQMPGR